jgi:hypothetical protein
MRVTQPIDLTLLGKELTAAGVAVPHGLGYAPTDDAGNGDVYTFEDSGAGLAEPVDLPPEAQPVVDAHVAPPRVLDYAGRIAKSALATSTGSGWTEVTRLPCLDGRVYLGTLELLGIDEAAFVARSSWTRWLWKRPTGGAPVVVGTYLVSDIADSGVNALDQRVVIDGTDAVVQVKGANNQTVAWLGKLDVLAYAVRGLLDAGPGAADGVTPTTGGL